VGSSLRLCKYGSRSSLMDMLLVSRLHISFWYRSACKLLLHCIHFMTLFVCLQCFDAVGWAASRAPGLYKTEWWGAGAVICLGRGADLHMAQLMPLSHYFLLHQIQIGFCFYLFATGSPGSLRQNLQSRKTVVVVVSCIFADKVVHILVFLCICWLR